MGTRGSHRNSHRSRVRRASEVRAHLQHELAILRRRPLDRDRARHAGRDLRRGRLALGRLRRVRRASPPTRRRTLDVLYSLNPRRDLTPHPPARAGFPRGGPENRGRHGRPLRAAGGRRALGRHQVHVHPVRRPPGRGQEGAFSSPSSRNRETSRRFLASGHERQPSKENPPLDARTDASRLLTDLSTRTTPHDRATSACSCAKLRRASSSGRTTRTSKAATATLAWGTWRTTC